MKKVGILGCGAIGSLIARAVDEGIVSARYEITLTTRKTPKLSRPIEMQKP